MAAALIIYSLTINWFKKVKTAYSMLYRIKNNLLFILDI
jgi:hypothetical protein